MARPEKVAVVDEIRTKLDESDAAVLTEYRGLTVHELAELRASLRPTDTQYKVFKNSLARRAIEGRGLDEITDLFEGPVAISWCRRRRRGGKGAASRQGRRRILLRRFSFRIAWSRSGTRASRDTAIVICCCSVSAKLFW